MPDDAAPRHDLSPTLEDIVTGVDLPRRPAENADAAWGRVADLRMWWHATRGPEAGPPVRPVLVVFAAEHGIARSARTSARPPDDAARQRESLARGDDPLCAVADLVGARIRVVDVGAEVSGSVDREDAMTAEQTEASFAVGAAVADQEIDSGADLLLVAGIGVGGSTIASILIGLLAPSDAVSVTGRGSGIDDAAWMRKCAAVRDGMRRGRAHKAAPLELLATVGGADAAAMTGLLLRSAQRRTPVLLDGLLPAAAGLVAHRAAHRSRDWWRAAHITTEPGHAAALDRLDLAPVLDLGIATAGGIGALLCLPVLASATMVPATRARDAHDPGPTEAT